MNGNRLALVLSLVSSAILGTGCTTELWQRDRFSKYHHPAEDSAAAELKFFYSESRRDILVEYNEVRNGENTAKRRAYWLESNRVRIDHARKPRFVSSDEARDLTPVPINATRAALGTPDKGDLYAVVSTNRVFTIYAGQKELLSGQLPGYYDRFKQTAARLLLTPATLTVDATTVAVVTSPYWAPFLAAALGHASYTPPPPPKPY